MEIQEIRPLFAARTEAFTLEQKGAVYSRYPHQVFVDDAIKQYGEASSYRSAETLFETMIRPFVSLYSPEHIRTVVDSAKGNSQIYRASETRQRFVSLFEQTMDLVADTAPNWQGFLGLELEYDTDGKRYVDLQDRMTEAGIWPVA